MPDSHLQADYQDQVTLTNPENNFEMPYARVSSFETYDEFKNTDEYKNFINQNDNLNKA